MPLWSRSWHRQAITIANTWDHGMRTKSAVRRSNLNLSACRSAFLEPVGRDRDAFYEQRLLLGLAWH